MAIWIVFFSIGSIGGFLSGFLGIGGGVVLIPLLTHYGQISIKSAATISLAFVVVSSFSGMQVHRKMGNIEIPTGLWLGISSVAGLLFGVLLTPVVSDYFLELIFLGVILAAAIMLVIKVPGESNTSVYILNKPIAVVIGIFKGVLTGMLGIGGGFLVVPLMICLMGMPVLKAIGTSLLVTFISGIIGFLGKAVLYETLTAGTWWVLVGSIPSALLGGWLAGKVRPRLLRIFLFILLVSIFAKMSFEIFTLGI